MSDTAQIQGIEFEIKGSADSAANSVEALATSLGKLKKVIQGGLGIKTVSKELRSLKKTNIGSALHNPIARFQKLILPLRKYASEAADSIKRLGKNLISAQWDKATKGVRTFSDKLKTLVSSFKRIMFYRVIRTIIKEIGEALKEGTENAYFYSKNIGDATKYISEAYDSLATASFTMKNQVGAAWATIFAMIQPILNQIIGLIQKAAEVVTQFFAILSGKSTYLKALNYAKDWAEETENGAKAAKEWKNQLLGFDEINRLEEPSSSNGSVGKEIEDYAAMFEEAKVDSWLVDIANNIRELWKSQDWDSLGEVIGDTLNNLFPSEAQWSLWGSQLARNVNGFIQTLYSAMSQLDFYGFGSRIASGFNSGLSVLLESGTFEKWGRLVVKKITAVVDFIAGFLGNVNWKSVGNAIGRFLRSALDESIKWLDSKEWDKVGQKIRGSLGKLIEGFEPREFGERLGRFIAKAANSASDFLTGLSFPGVISTISEALSEVFEGLRTEDVSAAIKRLWTNIKTQYVLIMSEFGMWLRNRDWTQVGEDFRASLARLWSDLKPLVSAIPWEELFDAIKQIITSFSLTIKPDSAEWDLSNVTAEEFGRKLVGSLTTLFLAYEGFKLFGVMGALTGTITGLKFSAIISDIMFEKGTNISETDLSDELLKPALNAIIGGIAGFLFTGSVSGAFMGAKLGLALTAGIDVIKFAKGDNATADIKSFENAINGIGSALIGGFMGAKIGTLFGGPIGGLVGFAIGAVLGLAITSIVFGDGTDPNIAYEEANKNRQDIELFTQKVELGLASWDDWRTDANNYGREIVSEISSGVSDNSSVIGRTVSTAVGDELSNESVINEVASTTSKIANVIPDAFTDAQTGLTITLDDIANLVKGKLGEVNVQSIQDGDQLYNNLSYLYSEIKGTADFAFSEMEASVSGHLQNIVNNVYSTIREINSALNFEWSIPRPRIPVIDVFYDMVWSGDGSSFSIPRFSVSWFARGGIVDGATLIGAGDAGKEAIIPLERNTEWISKVAAEMNRQVVQEEDGDLAADLEDANGVVVNAIMAAANQIINAMQDNDSGTYDFDSFVRKVSKVQRQQARASGAY